MTDIDDLSTPEVETEATDAPDDTAPKEEQDTFPREYVEKLRKESAGYRDKAKDRDALAHRLHAALVAATGKLADPSDLEYNEDHLTDPDALAAAVDDLLAKKPHLAARKFGNVGQGIATTTEDVDLAGLLRARA